MGLRGNTKKYAFLLLLLLLLTGCGKQEAVTETTTAPPETTDPKYLVTELQMIVTYENLGDLEKYENLTLLDATGSTAYPALEVYAQSHPDVNIIYTVDLGKKSVAHGTPEITLTAEETDYETLMTNLSYLKDTKKLILPKTCLTADELSNLQNEYPNLEISYTLGLAGQEFTADTTSLDLSQLTSGQLNAAQEVLARLPQLETVELMRADGTSSLSQADVEWLVNAAPNASFHYTFTLFGKQIATNDIKVEFKDLSLTEDDIPALRQALAIMTDCQAFVLDNCGLDNETMASIREDYPGTELVWRIQFGKYSAWTNAETIRAVYNVFDDTCENLKYCWRTKYMDIGHNETLTDLSFVGYMPDLEILIASGCAVKQLDGFENCKKLEFLELSNCGLLTDITPLSQCESLKRLNISYTKVEDLSPLDDLPLECFVYVKPKASQEELNRFNELHPECVTSYENNEYGYPWRYEQDGSFTPAYAELKEVFGYPDAKDTLW
mgnify:CR=1 FL=1